MTYRKRIESEADVYHVFARGTGRRLIFEDDDDRAEYCRRMGSVLQEAPGCLYAWCLMGNHVHFIMHMKVDALAVFMKRLNGGYARFFNSRHGRSGHLFEARFGSEPIASDQQLVAAVRYVHRNPLKPGLSETCDYAWSSFGEYIGIPQLVDTAFVLELFGGLTAFLSAHEADGDESFMDAPEFAAEDVRLATAPRRMTEDEAVSLAKSLLGARELEDIACMPREQRDRCLTLLRENGMSIRQVELVTGVNRNTVWAACNRTS